jgi:hypothetical protein
LLLLLALGNLPARADAIYGVCGTLTIPGNSSNPDAAETINFSFLLDYLQPADPHNPYPTIIGTPTVTSIGPLGTFSILGVYSQGYVGFFSPVAEIDLLMDFIPPPPDIIESWLYSCEGGGTLSNAMICASYVTPPGTGVYGTASGSVYLVSTPEPATACLAVLGVLALGFMRKRAEKRSSPLPYRL